MSSDGRDLDFNTYYLSKASKSARLEAATCRNPMKSRRDPNAQFWRPRLVEASKNQIKRDEKTDSKLFDPALQVAPKTSTSRSQDALLLSALPATIHAEKYESASANNEPIDITHYFRSVNVEFDLRTEDGLSEFTAWRNV